MKYKYFLHKLLEIKDKNIKYQLTNMLFEAISAPKNQLGGGYDKK